MLKSAVAEDFRSLEVMPFLKFAAKIRVWG